MKRVPSVLTVAASLMLIGCTLYAIANYEELAKAGGWGIVGIGGLVALAVSALVLDLFMGLFIKNRRIQNIIGAVIVLTLAILFFIGS